MSAADAAKQAARMTDPIEHGLGLLGMLAGLILGAIIGAILVAATIATGGGALAIAIAVVGAVGVTAGTGLAGGQLARGISTLMGLSGIQTGQIAPLCSSDTIVGNLAAARAVVDKGMCDGLFSLYHPPMPPAPLTPIAEGSSTVQINSWPAARQKDKLVCSANIRQGEPTVIIGGQTVRLLEVNDREAWLTEVLTYVAVGAAVVGLILLTGGWAAGAICGTVVLKTLAVGALMIAANYGLGELGDALGPGWRDTLQGGFGVGTSLWAGYKGLRMFGGRPFVSEPIDAVTGEVGIRHMDFTLPAALPFAFVRTYLSGGEHGSCLGPKWYSTWGQWLQVDGSKVFYVTDDGRTIDFDRPMLGNETKNRYVDKVRLRRNATGLNIRDAENRTLRFQKQVGDRYLLTAIEDLNGNAIRITHDDDGAIREVTHSGGYTLKVEGTPDRITRISQVNRGGGETELVRYAYSGSGMLSAVIDATNLPYRFEYDADGRITRWIDRVSDWFEYTWDVEGRCIAATGPASMYATRFTYDDTERTSVYTNSLGHSTTFVYNERLQVVEQIDPQGGTTTTVWDDRSNKLEERDPTGFERLYTYDEDGNLVEHLDPEGVVTRWTWSPLHKTTSFTDGKGNAWTREYDERGNLVEAAAPAPGVWRYQYDARGNLIKVTDPAGKSRTFGNDAAGVLEWETDWKGSVTRYARDEAGKVVRRTDRLGLETRFNYTPVGKLAGVEMAAGTTWSWTYDAQGKVTSQTDSNGRTTRYRYAPLGAVSEILQASGGRLRFVCDTESNLRKFVNEKGETFEYDYDDAGRVVTETDFAGRVVNYEYDPAGRLVVQTDGLGATTLIERNPFGQIVKKTAPDGVETTIEYDPLGNVIRATNDVSDVTFERDEFGRVVREVQNGLAIESTYDSVGRRVRRRTSSGHVTNFDFDENGVLAGLRLPGGDWLEFTRDENGREVERRASGGLLVNHEYDALGQVTRQYASAPDVGDPVPLEQAIDRRYRYDGVGNPTEIRDVAWGDATYEYDKTDMLRSANRSRGLNETFDYDSAENIVSSSRWLPTVPTPGDKLRALPTGTRDWEYEGGGRVRRIGTTRFEYDDDGRLVARTETETVGDVRKWRYSWSAEGRLQSVTNPRGQTWRYTYDAIGRRIGKKGPGVDITYVWDGDDIAEVIGEDTTVWVFEPGCFRPLLKAQNGETYYCVTDHIGTPRELVTGEGHLAWSAHFTVWGECDGQGVEETDCPVRFQGQWFDEESGLAFNHNRYYDPSRAAFMSPDPIGVEGDKKVYAFPKSPLAWIDPLGLQNDYTVYGLYKPGASTPYYVGQTSDFGATTIRHASPGPNGAAPRLPANWEALGYRHEPIASNLTYAQARGLEQHYIEQYGTLTGTRPGNVINQINPGRTDARAEGYRQAARDYLGCK